VGRNKKIPVKKWSDLQEALQELRVLIECINSLTKDMNECRNMNYKFYDMRKERQGYLKEQTELVTEINQLINHKN
jgi:hypothetical protein